MDKVDLTNCDREPIHLLGKVQSFGFLLAVTPDWIVSHVSENISDFLPVEPAAVLGRPVLEFVPADSIHEIRNRLQFLQPHKGVEVAYGLKLAATDRRFDVSVHFIESNVIMEFEPAASLEGAANDTVNVRIAVDRMADLPDIDAIQSHTARFIKSITGFDRTMFYKFAPDGCGEVVAEAKQSDMTPFLNLRYPATDIPKQARALYIENPIRLIADVSDDGNGILHQAEPDSQPPIDLSGSRLRSVSPIHLEYLRNMGVGASMSISVIVNGSLWGLIACHHNGPLVPSMRQRNCALLFGQMLSLILQARLIAEDRGNDERIASLTADISRSLTSETQSPSLLTSSAQAFCDILNADGFAVVQEAAILKTGTAPDDEKIRDLCDYLIERSGNEVFVSHHISSFISGWDTGNRTVAGVLSIPISRSPRDYILFFREELVQSVNWAGNPEKPVIPGPLGARLTPRKSFEVWQETVRDQSAEWTSSDLRAASQLRIMLLEVVLRMADEAGRERKAANEKQELLIAELNHRVRNILGLVRGLISQTEAGARTTEEFVRKLDSRVQSLARAHDQITRNNWSAASFSSLVETEVESYLSDRTDRISVKGPEVLLNPQAFSSMALVMHEMITNSAKYGAISVEQGRIEIDLTLDDRGGLLISWSEMGGPPVQAPERRGFGSTIIERTIPFELKGMAEVTYALSGVKASFRIPENFVEQGHADYVVPNARGTSVTRNFDAPRSVLIVEDNLIIAMDAEGIFEALGSQEVCVVSDVKSALTEIDGRTDVFDFALLDINLGSETSYPVALRLRAQNVPFVFASGYGENADIPKEIADARTVSKPYDKDVLIEAFTGPAAE
ncbi:HWE histidine kinase domain-containing protein [Roseibium sp.]|uniref:HWE histidine kinase domain-containing protein n=4 Tax=Roseibium sp. TaxID=1936156 RepID=UPI0032645F27